MSWECQRSCASQTALHTAQAVSKNEQSAHSDANSQMKRTARAGDLLCYLVHFIADHYHIRILLHELSDLQQLFASQDFASGVLWSVQQQHARLGGESLHAASRAVRIHSAQRTAVHANNSRELSVYSM